MAKFIYPDYQGACFANIPTTILSLFGLKTYQFILPSKPYRPKLKKSKPNKIVLFLIDGFGFVAWQKYGLKHKIFRLISQKGLVSPITSVFPSTTASALTTIHSGLTPQQHGLFEWFVYMPEIDKTITTLSFSLPGEKEPDTLAKKGVNPAILFHGTTLYQILTRAGITAYTITPQNYTQSTYSKLTTKGAKTIGYREYSDLLTTLTAIQNDKNQSYSYVYLENLDSAAHHFGPGSKEYLQALKRIAGFLEKVVSNLDKKTLLIITADHGQTSVNPDETIFLNKINGIEDFFAISPSGKPILPCGNPRDIFFHIKPNKLNQAIKFLKNKLRGKAEIIKVDKAIDMGLFGLGKPSKKFIDRAGNLLVLPNNHQTIWYEYPGTKLPRFLGHHGGLSKEEMLIPLAVSRLLDLTS